MIGRKRAIELLEKILWMTEEYVQLASKPKSYGTKERFFRLDIHLIYSIGKNPGINVTALAQLHGISKSAVSQAVRKLIERKLVRRYQVPENRKEILFELSERGKEAFTAHQSFHSSFENPYIEELAVFSDKEVRTVEKVLELLMRRAKKAQRREKAAESLSEPGLADDSEGEKI